MRARQVGRVRALQCERSPLRGLISYCEVSRLCDSSACGYAESAAADCGPALCDGSICDPLQSLGPQRATSQWDLRPLRHFPPPLPLVPLRTLPLRALTLRPFLRPDHAATPPTASHPSSDPSHCDAAHGCDCPHWVPTHRAGPYCEGRSPGQDVPLRLLTVGASPVGTGHASVRRSPQPVRTSCKWRLRGSSRGPPCSEASVLTTRPLRYLDFLVAHFV